MTKVNINLAKIKPGKIRLPKLDLRAAMSQEPTPDPLADVELTGDVEVDSANELSALLTGFRERARQENDRFTLATDSEFWFSIGFKSREQKETFLAALEWLQFGDKYLDGTAVAHALGIILPPVQLSNPVKRGVDRRLSELT